MNNFNTQLNKLLQTNNFNLEMACKELIRSNLKIAINELLVNELTAFYNMNATKELTLQTIVMVLTIEISTHHTVY